MHHVKAVDFCNGTELSYYFFLGRKFGDHGQRYYHAYYSLSIHEGFLKITYSKDSLEVLISLKDKTSSLLAGEGGVLSVGRAMGISRKNRNPASPHGDTRFDVQSGGEARSNSNSTIQTIKLVTPHNLTQKYHIHKRNNTKGRADLP